MDAAKLNNLAIVSVTGATRLGRVTEVLFDTDPLRISALKASGGEGEFVVPMGQIVKIGADAVMVDKPNVSQPPAGEPRAGTRSLTELTKLKVVDEDGSYVGMVRSIEIDADSGDVETIHAGEGGILGIGGRHDAFPRDSVLGVGPDLLTVAGDVPGARDEDEPESREDDERRGTVVRREAQPVTSDQANRPQSREADQGSGTVIRREAQPVTSDQANRPDSREADQRSGTVIRRDAPPSTAEKEV